MASRNPHLTLGESLAIARSRAFSFSNRMRRGGGVPLDEQPTPRERHDRLVAFYDGYEGLVETLCDAAQYGPSEALEAKYQQRREWMSEAYPEVRKFLVAFLQYSIDDASQGIALWGRSADAFEALFAAPSLEAFLEADDGTMISRIERTREALYRYGEHLRQLAKISS